MSNAASWPMVLTDNGTDGCIVVSPVAPTFNDVCGIAGDSYTITATPGVTYYVNGVATAAGVYDATGTITITATVDTTLYIMGSYPAGGWTHTYAGNCPTEYPPTPSPEDPCGLNNAHWDLTKLSNTDPYTWSLSNGHLIATTVSGYEFAAGVTTKDFGLAVDSNRLCVVEVPAAPSQTDPCGLNNARWTTPPNNTVITWSVNANNELIATTTDNYTFADGKTHNYGTPTESGHLCAVVVAPTVSDFCGTKYDAVITVGSEGVTYSEEWNEDHTQVEVTATANEGYEIPAETKTSWTLSFPNASDCEQVTLCHATDSTTNPYRKITVSVNAADGVSGNSGQEADHFSHTGPIYYDGIEGSWGDIIPEIGDNGGRNLTVLGQYMLDNDCMLPAVSMADYKVSPCVATTVPTIDTFTVTITNTADDSAGAVDYTVTLGSDTRSFTLADGESRTLTYPGLTAGSYSLVVMASDGTKFTPQTVTIASCGSVLGESTVTPIVAVTQPQKVMPAELPATGGESNYLELGVALSVATYFIALRRQEA
ncbi:MAG: hypothetical protein WBB33_01360 [Candidatus Saccharimonadales bacterium]